MPNLISIALKETRGTMKGILALVLNAPDPSSWRHIAVNIGVTNHRVMNKFFDQVITLMKLLIAQAKGTFASHVFDLKYVRRGDLTSSNHDETLRKILSLKLKLFKKHPEIFLVFSYGADEDLFDDEEVPDQLDDSMASVTFVCSPNNKNKLK